MALAYDFSGVYQNLSDEASRALSELGVTSADADALSALSFENVMAALSKMAGSGMTAPLKGLITMTAVLLLCSMLTAYQNSLTESGETVQTVAVLCLSGAVAVPAVGFIGTAGDVIAQCANLFLAYIPIMAVMLAASGKAVSSASYQALTVAAGQGVMRVSSDMILPLLHIFLGIAVSSGIAPQVGLGGFLSLITKLTKWLLGFVMAIFTAVLSLRQAASGALDSLGSKAARFALSSFVPVVGSALSEAYKTVQGSLHVLRSGLGIFVILALAFTFLPVLLQGLGWSLCLFVGKALAEALGVSHCAKLLEALGTVFSTIAAAAAFAIGGEA